MTRAIDTKKAINYIRKAEGALRMAKIAIKEGEYDSATMSAVHGAINALDALTISILVKMASGAHTGMLSLVKRIFTPISIPKQAIRGCCQRHILIFKLDNNYHIPL